MPLGKHIYLLLSHYQTLFGEKTIQNIFINVYPFFPPRKYISFFFFVLFFTPVHLRTSPTTPARVKTRKEEKGFKKKKKKKNTIKGHKIESMRKTHNS